ncbi:STAS domain-containing protein [Modestobacter altitudinis]|uniref:STAS domain-containing protein n=1 Tax=Modestobacter altitudinis TaxID=2213158 RepID=UPI00110CEBAD|nr:STAS domain-containing protein [Modestobacter altitudinis]
MAPDTEPRPDGEVVWAEDATGPLLRFSGSIDREAVRRFRLLMPPATWPARADLGAVTALSAAGLELLVHLARKPRRSGGELELTALPEHLRPVLARAGLATLAPRTNGTPTSA